MNLDELIYRVRARGGEIRLIGSAVQYRPAGAFTEGELDWLRRHEDDVVVALAAPDARDRDAFLRWLSRRFGDGFVLVGDAGPDTPAWTRWGRSSE